MVRAAASGEAACVASAEGGSCFQTKAGQEGALISAPPLPSPLPFPASVLQGWNRPRSRRQGTPPGAGTEQGGDGWGVDLSPLTVPSAVPGTLQGAADTRWVSRSPVLDHKSVVTPGECDEEKCWLRIMSR